MALTLQSSSFEPKGDIPTAFTGDGQDRSPALRWSGGPEATKTYALIVHDPGAPSGDFAHWLVYNIPVTTTGLPEAGPHRGDLSDGTLQGRNDFDRIGYGGPKPPPGKPHRYQFELYALDAKLPLDSGATREE